MMENPRDLSNLQELIGYTFRDLTLLRQALTTPSYGNENPNFSDKNMKAFTTLGDAVVSVIVIQSLMEKGLVSKGEITEEKVKQVKNKALSNLMKGIGLEEYILWGEGQKKQEHWNSDHLASDCLEALICAVYLDCCWNMRVVTGVFQKIKKFNSKIN